MKTKSPTPAPYPAILARQRLALSAYHPADYDCTALTNHAVEEDGALDGDTLALFIWREVGESGSHQEAAEMLDTAIAELSRVASKLRA